MTYGFNAEFTRCVVTVPLSLACYEGKVINGRFEGTHVGVVSSQSAAWRWLNGEKVQLLVVYPDISVKMGGA